MSGNITDSQAIAEQIKAYIQGRRDKKEVKLLKDKPNKKGKGGINTRLISVIEKNDDQSVIKKLKGIVKAKKDKEEPELDFVQNKYQQLVQLTASMAQDVINDYQAGLDAINEEHEISAWLDKAASKAGGRNFATHVIKLTHSSISTHASSIYDETKTVDTKFLTTSSIASRYIDVTGNAGVSHYTDLLEIEHNGKALKDYIIEDNGSPIESFSKNDEQLKDWVNGFKAVMVTKRKSSHYLAKQIYFPLNSAIDGYHLILPIVSSSLAHNIYTKCGFSDQKKGIWEAKKEYIYIEEKAVTYPKKAVQNVTASLKAHPNVSALNKERKGQLFLLPCIPPKWKTTKKPPIKLKNLFYGKLRFSAKEDILALQKYMVLLKQKGLNSKDPKLHAHLLSLIGSITDRVFKHVSSIQNLRDQAGWSAQSKLKISHQLWLDPYREEDNFQQQRKQSDWQSEITNDFAAWLNKQLDHRKLTLSLAQESFWKKVMQQCLREFEAFREAQS